MHVLMFVDARWPPVNTLTLQPRNATHSKNSHTHSLHSPQHSRKPSTCVTLATLSFTSKGMLKDRVYGIQETLFHDPYYQRHVVGAPVVRRVEAGRIHSEANYAVFRTKLDKPSTVFNVGRYIDTIVQTPDGLKFAERLVVYDSEMISNAIIYPILKYT